MGTLSMFLFPQIEEDNSRRGNGFLFSASFGTFWRHVCIFHMFDVFLALGDLWGGTGAPLGAKGGNVKKMSNFQGESLTSFEHKVFCSSVGPVVADSVVFYLAIWTSACQTSGALHRCSHDHHLRTCVASPR